MTMNNMGNSEKEREDFGEVTEKDKMNSNEVKTDSVEKTFMELLKVSSTTDSVTVDDEDEILAKIFSGLPAKHDIQFKILVSLPLQSVLKFRCVSKEFRSLFEEPLFAFEHARRLSSISPFTGIFYQNFHGKAWHQLDSDQPSFISTNTDAGGLPDSSLSFLKEDKLRDQIQLIDSCNGLLLCRKTNTETGIRKLYVCNPLTMQKVFVPHPWKRSCVDNYFALITQSNPTGYLRFKVLCAHDYAPKFECPLAKLWIFSLETCKWEEFKDKTLPVLSHSTMMRSKVFIKDTLFWDCFEGYILVWYLNNNASSSACFDLIEAPKYQLGRCLWDHNGKLLCYCHGYDQHTDEFSVWSLTDQKNNKLGWEIDNSQEFKFLAEDVRNGYFEVVHQQGPTKVLPHVLFKVVAYNPSLKTMYLSIYNMIFSYELTERRFEFVWGLGYERLRSGTCVLQYMHSLEHIETGGTQA